MTEYWVSQPKYYCKICNCYMADNKMSRQHHDNSVRHKINLDKSLKDKKNQRLQGARSERELHETLQQIEKAAREAMVADGSVMYATSSDKPPPPPPLHKRNHNETSGSGSVPDNQLNEIPQEENTGYYTIRGKTYLDGKVFQDKLRNGRNCEIFVEDLDDWFPGIITARKEVHIPNTTITIVSFEVQYTVQFEDGREELIHETNVRSDRLRLVASEELDQDILTAIASEQTQKEIAIPLQLDNNTGVSVWQTVSVNYVNEEEERKAYQQAVEEMYKNTAEDDKMKEQKTSVNDVIVDFQPKTYKGIVIEDSLISINTGFRESDNEDDDRDKIISFKKRKFEDHPAVKEESATGDGKPLFKQMKSKNFRKK